MQCYFSIHVKFCNRSAPVVSEGLPYSSQWDGAGAMVWYFFFKENQISEIIKAELICILLLFS